MKENNWFVYNTKEVEGNANKFGIYGGKFAPLGQEAKSEKLGFNITTIEPGLWFCPYHLHHLEEEMILVLEGEITVRQENETKVLKVNDLIFFKTKVAHQIYNSGNVPAKLLAISNKDPNDICEYPDSNKIYMRGQKKIYQMGTEKNYMDGEEQIAKFWQK
ncbi:cupin domain-containing protein [Dolichospermum sp. ST_sed1]|nr:cupin domain-containing protein [Dolichospermum sp. ST_sed1]